MRAVAEHFITEEEYLKQEAVSPTKHEYFNGRIYAMSGGSNTHAILCTNSAVTAANGLRGRPYRVVGSQQRVKIEATGLLTYPDVSIYCPPARFEGRHNETLLNPVVLIEVLSPSTASYDRGEKFQNYSQLPSLTDYLLITQERVLVEHFRRRENDWVLRSYNQRDQQVELPDIDLVLPLSELYADVDVPVGLVTLRAVEPDGLE